MATIYDAYLEVDAGGSCLAQLLDLPGCFAVASSTEGALQALVARIPLYHAWLTRHDEYTPVIAGPYEVAVSEVHDVAPSGMGAFFAPDAYPVEGDDLDWLLALLEWSCEDVIDRSSAANGVLGRVSWYLAAAGARLPESAPPDVQAWLRALLAAARDVPPGQRSTVLEVNGERWSLRKALRRGILLAHQTVDLLS